MTDDNPTPPVPKVLPQVHARKRHSRARMPAHSQPYRASRSASVPAPSGPRRRSACGRPCSRNKPGAGPRSAARTSRPRPAGWQSGFLAAPQSCPPCARPCRPPPPRRCHHPDAACLSRAPEFRPFPGGPAPPTASHKRGPRPRGRGPGWRLSRRRRSRWRDRARVRSPQLRPELGRLQEELSEANSMAGRLGWAGSLSRMRPADLPSSPPPASPMRYSERISWHTSAALNQNRCVKD